MSEADICTIEVVQSAIRSRHDSSISSCSLPCIASDDKIPASDFKTVKSKFQHYLDNYYFEKEIETMAPLYSNDVYRIKNMRLKILEALEDKRMMDEIEELIEQI